MFIRKEESAQIESEKIGSNWKVNKGQRIIVIEHDSVKKYISQRKKQVSYFQTKPTEVIENSDINPRLTIKQRLRTEILGRPSYNQLDMEMEQFSWQKNLTIAEKKNLLNNLAKNYQKFKKITDKSVENNRNFMPNIKRPAFSAKNHAKMISFNPGKEKLNKEERAKTCAVYEKGENRIKRIFEGRGDDEITNKENTNNNERRNIKKLEKEEKNTLPLKELEYTRKRLIREINKLKERGLNFQ